ncbi:MAG: hypothetical protein IFNCLDLE_02687 [Ignavibacteriaceae bacterium]|nr:hypothetical protein [Ignavibacteriaceae bacterium]
MTIPALKIKVSQMESPKSGSPVANQYEIRTDDGVYFQSYRSIIAFRPYGDGKIVLDEYYWDYSRTTGKYRNEFLGENTAETRKKIKSGEYILANLN